MDKDINEERHSDGTIRTFALSAEVSQYASTMTPTSLLKYSPTSIRNIIGSSENLSYNNLSKTVMTGGDLSGDVMLGVAQQNGQRLPYLLLFRIEKNGEYAYDLYSLSSLSLGDCVVQCRHLDSLNRSGHTRYLSGELYIEGRNAMPDNKPVEISAMSVPAYSNEFREYLSSAIDTAISKLR